MSTPPTTYPSPQAGQSVLFLASWHGYLPLVQELLSNGAHVDTPDRVLPTQRGWTPLIIAVHQGFADIAEELVAAGADVDHQDMFGRKAGDRAKGAALTAVLKQKPPHKDVEEAKVSEEVRERIETRVRKEAEEAMSQASSLLNTVAKEAEARFTAEVQDYARSKLKEVYRGMKLSAFEVLEKTMRENGMEIPPSRLASSEFNVEFPAEEVDQAMEDTSDFISKLLAEHYLPLPESEWKAECQGGLKQAAARSLSHAEEVLTQLCEDGTSALASGFILQLQDSLSSFARKTLEHSSVQLERSLEAVIQARVEEIVGANTVSKSMDRSRSAKSVKTQESLETASVDTLALHRSPQGQTQSRDVPERLYKSATKPIPSGGAGKSSSVPRTTVSSTLKQFLSAEVKFDF